MTPLADITDKDCLEVAEILGNNRHISEPSRIAQVKELFAGFHNKQTNIPGYDWYRAFKYLERKGYAIE